MGPLVLPLFPLSVALYPGVVLPLHIFEERYRRLVRGLLDIADGARIFGVIGIRAGRESGGHDLTDLHEIGCTADLRYVEAYEDGRFDIIVTGGARFRLLEVERTEPLRGRVQLLDDHASDRSVALSIRVGRAFLEYRTAMRSAQGQPDEPGAGPELPEDPAEMAYLVAAAMILDLTDKQRLLAAPTVDDRLRLELSLLRREESLVGGLSLRPAVELPRLPFTSN